MHLIRHTLAGLRVLLLLTVLLGVAYPLAVTGLAQVTLDWRASGSLVTEAGAHTTSYDDAVGSALVGQDFAGAEWFHSRPSAAGDGYDPLATAGSNLGPTSPDLLATVEERRAAAATEEGVAPSAVPPDAVTASASGLDPHISPAWAAIQVARVARERGLDEEVVRRLVADHTQGRTFGVLGAPRVDVLGLNLALADLAGPGLED
ncbi:potassium-transporting ATPase subunit KdpC [Nocardioides currus]|uniref:Potassium-transporting ATPase KdpC subunit n=1 Tax=Nocardioides currus TaxID=2133958 RepID=A0A2R7Z2V0_9ACTN|nr:potassium-transporting ATPase subunit KdpC [Nocardioides currus]PUA82967.1 potassium-transporting ATPase subunit C [Nocardioides currus]